MSNLRANAQVSIRVRKGIFVLEIQGQECYKETKSSMDVLMADVVEQINKQTNKNKHHLINKKSFHR